MEGIIKTIISRTIARIRQRIDQALHTWRYGRKQSTWEDFFRIRGNSFDFDHTLTLDLEKLNSHELNSMALRKIIGLTNRGLIVIRCSRPKPYKENVLGYHQVYHKGRLIAQEELRIEGKGASTSLIEIPTFVSIDYCSDPRGEGNLQLT